ncbi:peptidylprolyl isomerase [Aliiroseovarius sp. M344]|uniref:peptidylprolyl isomerase n=1 Tax=Aliiroseovarius sp. M344 TaxID=2867010 RepID=UPI0021AD6EA1|nr:peptidylprolyl isomerase [Aliiroseovarius sp. M344]UWQ15647.1 peptidylprolyl isomerase [Aliiroseovarius sp. M344]
MANRMINIRTSLLPKLRWTPRIAVALVAGLLIITSLGATKATAQDLFAPVKKINDRVITAYELSQRIAFLTILKAPGNLNELAIEQLTNEALQRQAAELVDVEPTAEELLAGMEEFTGRFNLDVESFNKIIAQAGIAPETFRDFVSGGIAWRAVVRARWAGRVQVTDDEVDRQLALTRPGAGVRVLLSEIILPAQTPAQMQISNARASELSQITTLPAFASAARQYSVAPSRGRSGRLEWIDLSNLPPAVAAQILPLAPGHVSDPIPVKNGVAVFQLRAIEETDAPAPASVTVDYATLLLPGGRSEKTLTEAAKIRAKADRCDDLYGIVKDLPPSQLQREALPMAQVPSNYALELAKLDEGEVSTGLTSASGQNLVFLMLCSRTRDLPEEISREDIKLQLQNQRLQSFANAYLDELKAAAYIEDYTGQ